MPGPWEAYAAPAPPPAAPTEGQGGPWAEYGASLEDFAAQEALAQGLDPDLVRRVGVQESGWNAGAVSPVGARGPMQLMPATAAELGVDPDDPYDNIRGGVRYLKQQMDAFGSPDLALAAYNAGPGAVQKYGGIPPYEETQNYVRSIMGGYTPGPVAPSPEEAMLNLGPRIPEVDELLSGEAPVTMRIEDSTDPEHLDWRARQNEASGYNEARAGARERSDIRGGADLTSMLTASLNDEMAGAVGYGVQGGINLFRDIAGLPIKISAEAAGDAEADQVRLDTAAYRKDHPWLSGLTETLGGAAIVPGGPVATGFKGLASGVGMNTALGAGYGAATNEGDRLGGAYEGAIWANGLGLAANVAARPIAGAFKAGKTALADRAAPPMDLPEGVTPRTARQAGRYVADVMSSAGMTPEQIAALPQTGKPVTAAEAIGRPGQAALGALARRSGQTADNLTGVAAERQLSRGSRLQDDFETVAGISPEAVAGDVEAMVMRGREAAAPLYEAAYARGAVQSDVLDALVQRPSMKTAMSRAVRIAAEEGRDPRAIGFDFDAQGNVLRVQEPTAQTWDYVKRGLDDIIEGYRDKTTGKLVLDEEGRAIVRTLKAMREEVVRLNPAYGDALATSGDYLSANQAFIDGGKFAFSGKITERQFSQKLAAMGPGEREAFKGGIANHLFDLAQNGKLDPKILATPRVRQKLEMALGQREAGELIASAQQEAQMLGFERRYAPGANSITQEMKAAMDEQDIGSPVLGALIEAGVAQARNPGANGLANWGLAQVGKLGSWAQTPAMPVGVRDEAGRMLMMSPQELAEYFGKMNLNVPNRAPNAAGVYGAGAGAFLSQAE